jgi:ubiquinone/menaquinone biosynthesis C-methylase UbiE
MIFNFTKAVSFFILLFGIVTTSNVWGQDREPVTANRYELLSGESRTIPIVKVDEKKDVQVDQTTKDSVQRFLRENYEFIPKRSKVLEVGMGEGNNTVFLGTKGYQVIGVDVSSVSVLKARTLAREKGIQIKTITASPETLALEAQSFDAIISFYQPKKKLLNKLTRWLKPGGILIIESYTHHQLKKKGFEYYPKDELFAPAELLSLFSEFRTLKYEEPLHRESYTTSGVFQKLR